MFGKAEGSFLKVLIEIYAKAADSINDESKPNSLEINNFSSINKLLISDINKELLTPPPAKIQESILKLIDILINEKLFISNELGFDSSFIESAAFAYISIRTFKKLPSAFPNTTGCQKKSICGSICKP